VESVQATAGAEDAHYLNELGVSGEAEKFQVELEVGWESPSTRCERSGEAPAAPLWKQIEADILNRPVITMRHSDAGTLGAAILAGVGVGCWDTVRDGADATVREDRMYLPNQHLTGPHEEAYATYREAYDALVPTFDRRARARAASQ
jgi:xylulokinase